MLFKANEISVALYMALLAAFLAFEAFLDLAKAWEFADSLANVAWTVCWMTGRFRACKGDLICVATLSLPVGDWGLWAALGVTLFVLLAFLG